MVSRRTLAIVGASLAGAKAAEAARAAGFDDRIVLIGDEPHLPYERPPLSKDVLRGDAEPESARVHSEGFYSEHDIELLTARAVAIDVRSRRFELDRGAPVAFDNAVLATGAAPRRLRIPGAGLGGVHYLRTIDDAVHLRDAIRTGGRVAVIGAGWIGTEVAASARQMRADVVLIDQAPVPLHRVLGDEIGEVFRRVHADHGVALRFNTGVSELRGAATVEQVVLDDGTIVPADVVVVGIGVTPRTELVDEIGGFRVDDGILTNANLETDVPGIYAAGDIARAWHPHYGRHLRVEHWANALNQGDVAGRNAAGRAEFYTRLPYFFSDQFDLGMEYVGHHERADSLVIRGELAARKFVAFWHRENRITAAMHVNVWDIADDLKALVQARIPIHTAGLTDPDVSIADLAGTCA